MASQDKDKIIKPGDPGFHVDAPRPNPGSNTADRLAGALPGAPAPTGRPGDTTAAYESPSPEAPRSAIGPRHAVGQRMPRETKPRAPRIRERTHAVRGGLNRMWLQADTFLERQVAQRPLGIVGGAFAAGYVISAGLPRWFTRNLARVALPLAATAYLVRLVSDMSGSEDVSRYGRRPEGSTSRWT